MSAKTKAGKSRTSRDDLPGARDVSRVHPYRSFAFYGRSGSGKTTLASSFPKPILVLDIRDQGTDSIADIEGIQVRDITSHEEMNDAHLWLLKNPSRYKTVVIDTVSQWQQLVVNEIGSRHKGKTPGDWGSMTKRDWGDVSARLKEGIINYRDLTEEGMQVVFIAQDRVFNLSDDEEESIADDQIAPEVGPALSPATAKYLNAAVSVIGNTFIRVRTIEKEVRGKKRKEKKTEYGLRLGPNPVYVTKIRKPKSTEAPPAIYDPNYEDIIEIIKGES